MAMTKNNSSLIIGASNESPLIEGWHERQRDGRNNIPFRAAKKTGVIQLSVPENSSTVNLILSGPVGIIQSPVMGTISINGKEHSLELAVDAWVLRSFPITEKTETLNIRLTLPTPVVPDSHLQNGDARQLGWYLSAVWVE